MKHPINMFLVTEVDYRCGLAHRLLDEGIVDFCLAAINPYTNLPEKHDNIVEVNLLPSGDMEYSMICDINEFPALDKTLLEKMLPYESMALKMGIRRSFSKEIFEYEDEKRKYLQHIRYWNYMLKKYEINFIFCGCTPHSQGTYVVYALSKIYNIPFLILERTGVFNERKVWGNSIETLGKSVEDVYNQIKETKNFKFRMDEDIARDYQVFCENARVENYVKKPLRSSRQIKKAAFSFYKTKRNEFLYEFIRYNVRARVKPDTINDLKNREVWFRLRRKQLRSYRYYIKHQIMTTADYNKIAVAPDYSKKYVCFFIQVYPEATVIPRAGVFADQYTSIQLLARAAEKAGIVVYVKEHPAKSYRPKDFFSEIRNIKNVVLIRTDCPSAEVIRNCVAVATQTGTCCIEAGFLGKPAIVFSEGHPWKACPNLFEMVDEDQGAKLLNDLMGDYSIDKNEMLKYIYAFQSQSVREVSVKEELKRVHNYDYVPPEFPIEDRVELIKSFLRSNSLENNDVSELRS